MAGVLARATAETHATLERVAASTDLVIVTMLCDPRTVCLSNGVVYVRLRDALASTNPTEYAMSPLRYDECVGHAQRLGQENSSHGLCGKWRVLSLRPAIRGAAFLEPIALYAPTSKRFWEDTGVAAQLVTAITPSIAGFPVTRDVYP